MGNYELFKSIINGSIEFEMEVGGQLTVTSYRTGESVTLDLSRINEDMFDELVTERDDEDDYDDDDD
jgi:hypothetical protein